MMAAEIARAQAKPTDNLSAYDLYLRAMSRKSAKIRRVQPAKLWSCSIVQLPPTHGFHLHMVSWPALIGIALFIHGVRSPRRRHVDMKRPSWPSSWARTTLSLCRSAGYGIAYLGGRLEEGLAHIERALTLNPNSPRGMSIWRHGLLDDRQAREVHSIL